MLCVVGVHKILAVVRDVRVKSLSATHPDLGSASDAGRCPAVGGRKKDMRLPSVPTTTAADASNRIAADSMLVLILSWSHRGTSQSGAGRGMGHKQCEEEDPERTAAGYT